MSRMGRRRQQQKVIVAFEIIGLIFLAAGVFAVFDHAVEQHAQKAAAVEPVKQTPTAQKKKQEKKKVDLTKWNIILVNEWNAIPEDFRIETAETEGGYLVDARIRKPLEKMLEDCRKAGFSPQIISGYRSYETQQYLYNTTENKADTALPGHSEHECGLALDIVDVDSTGWDDLLIDEQENMPAQKWLMEHCQDYGFILRYPKGKKEKTGIIYEPWHYRYVGVKHAKKIMKQGICLEEYIEQCREQ